MAAKQESAVPPTEANESEPSLADRVDGDAGASTNVWPDAAAEQAFFSENLEHAAVPALAASAIEETDAQGLPPLEELVKRIPAEVRDTLDDLFRVKYTAVRRVPKKDLKA